MIPQDSASLKAEFERLKLQKRDPEIRTLYFASKFQSHQRILESGRLLEESGGFVFSTSPHTFFERVHPEHAREVFVAKVIICQTPWYSIDQSWINQSGS